ncbi:MAG: CARDB domain-containing protein [Acidobacteriota bacterium]
MKLSIDSKFRKLLFWVFIFTSVFFFSNLGQDLQADTSKRIKIKPDLQIYKFSINKSSIRPDKSHVIKLNVVVRNVSPVKNCTGPFKILVEWSTHPKKSYKYLTQAGVARLCSDPHKIKQNMVKRTFTHSVPSGKTYYYKVTVDSNSNVSESNERNNWKIKKYFALPVLTLIRNPRINAGSIADRLPSCEGIDLIVKNVEVIRATSGAIFIKATIKNLCEGSCTGPIVIEVDESDFLGRPGGVEQQIANGIGSKAEFTMFSALGIANNSDRTYSYVVSVRSEGGCVEDASRRGNNSYRITVDPR